MIARLRNLGFILYHGVPNTTSVTQEMDQSYGILRAHFQKNLELTTQHRLEANKPISINPSLIGLLVFCGKDPETKHTDYHNAFDIDFRKEKCLEAWAKVGAAPLTRSRLAPHKFHQEGGFVGDTFEKYTRTRRRGTTRVACGWISKDTNTNI